MIMDWKKRFSNPNFLIHVALSIIAPVGAYFGLTGADVTSWCVVIDTAGKALQNPYVLVTCAVSLINAIHNPTTKGFLDARK